MVQKCSPQDEEWFLHDFSKEAGIPSAPAAEDALSSAQASSMSFSEKVISVRDGPSPTVSKNSGTSLTFHCSLGSTKTELYCSLNAEAANSGLGFGLLVAGSIKGQS